jgi:Mrp family chromosome partitioning ATPase
MSSVKKVIGVVSGKGGVGKSLVTSMLAVTMSRMGYHTAILDADITGPSIPKAFGLSDDRQSHIPEKRNEEYYKKRPCARFVEYAAILLDEYIQNKKLEEN